MRRHLTALALVLVVAVAIATGAGARSEATGPLTVYAAASLTEAFRAFDGGQSYNFAGNLIVVPRDRVEPVDADGASFMTFIVSGGVSGMTAAKTYLDTALPLTSRKSRP